METNGDEHESWYYFIKYNGNEQNLQHLQYQLEKVEWTIEDDYSTFDLELDHLLSENTAKEMIRLDLNHTAPHRKFDGTLEQINFGFKKKDKNMKRIKKVNKLLGYGAIEDFIDQEDIDPESNRVLQDIDVETDSGASSYNDSTDEDSN